MFRRAISIVLACVIGSVCTNEVDARTLREEQHCLALSIYWEARGESRLGMIAVGWTILNRMRSRHFPSTPCGVVYQGGEQPPCQFSWWCDGRSDRPRDIRSWRSTLLIAARLLVDPPADPTGGALFYHSTRIKPPWRRKRVRTTRIGGHVFYR
ncbi:MAG: cell wall hydrolase [Woeseia sp.]